MDGDLVLYKWTPNQIAEMDRAQVESVIAFHKNDPPTMDYMVELMRSTTEVKLAHERIAQLDAMEKKNKLSEYSDDELWAELERRGEW